MPQSNSGKIIKLGLVLFVVTAITGLILGVVNEITAEPIRLTQERLKAEAFQAVLPEADKFENVAFSDGKPAVIIDEKPIVIMEVNEAQKGGEPAGYCVTVSPSGYAGPVDVVVGITKTGSLNAIRILRQSETPGLGAKASLPAFYGQYDNKEGGALTVVKQSPQGNEIQAISGATITSKAVTDGVNAALEYWASNLKGSE